MKNFWESKTLWFNLLGFAGMMFGVDGALGHVLAPEEVAAGLALGNAALRFTTTTGLIK